MTIHVKIIADSIAENAPRLTTFQLRYPRFIHSEFMTHRMLSRSASSSRAIPVSKLIRDVLEDPAEPVSWGSNQRGMQAGEPLKPWQRAVARFMWRKSRYVACGCAWVSQRVGLHKQVANRLLEPWSHISVVATATDWANFFALRCHKDADPTFQLLAAEMKLQYAENRAFERIKKLKINGSHLPYVSDDERLVNSVESCLQMSAARCARVSYNNHDGSKADVERDSALVHQLLGSPVHASPFEHQAWPDPLGVKMTPDTMKNGNFAPGWVQHRKIIPNENISEYK